jgi:hypothetical protein
MPSCKQNATLRLRGSMTDKHDETSLDGSAQSLPSGQVFQIHVKGHLNETWSDWLEGLEVELLDNGKMILSGPISDQSALMGILNKLNRLNLTLLSVCEVSKNK